MRREPHLPSEFDKECKEEYGDGVEMHPTSHSDRVEGITEDTVPAKEKPSEE